MAVIKTVRETLFCRSKKSEPTTRDDDAVYDAWCAGQLALYDTVICLDGSAKESTAHVARRCSDKLIYLHEREFQIPHKTDHGLRRIVHHEIVRRFGHGHWIMCCHSDEFCYHDPRKIVQIAERGGYDLVSWYSPHFYPHQSELADWPERGQSPVPERHRHYHWGHLNSGVPWIEDRLYHDAPGVEWDEVTHGSVRPHGLQREAPFHPIFRHFKVIATDISWCEVIGGSTYYRHHWQGLEHRTGVPFQVRRFEDLFVTSVPKYTVCDRYDGVFDQPWNMGEEFRPDSELRRETLAVTGNKDSPFATKSETPPLIASNRIIVRSETSVSPKWTLRVALGPENPAFGSWNWLGADLARELGPASQPSADGLGCVWNTPTTTCPDSRGGLARLTSD